MSISYWIHVLALFIIYTVGYNYALFRPATQSSTYMDNVAGKAVDGIATTDKSISYTEEHDLRPWWKVQLAYPILVTHVGIRNRHNFGKEK